MALRPADIIDGARIAGKPGAYVLGCFDSRITFYSQQVRALELAHALHNQHHVAAHARIAVIGGGAGGVTVAAALALQSDATIFLYEQSDVLIPLQRESQRRRLDPHIYDWPRRDSQHEFAELPLLDWKSGSAVQVREAVLREFNELRSAAGDRPAVNLSHLVTSVAPKANGFDIHFEREGVGGERQSAQTEVDIVIFAFGFGIEPKRGIPNTITESYWLDAGVPSQEIDGNPRPRFFVSGNGDGGLIDLVAAASATFDHSAMIRAIAQRPGVRTLAERLLTIDTDARSADSAGQGFDFMAAYEASIGADIEALGLVDEIAGRLRPGVQLFFQTREADLMSIRTATLNRLVVYLVIKACRRDPSRYFEHIVCANVTSLDPPVGFNQPTFLLDCDGRQIAADKVIVRRGPGRDSVRAPFAAVLDGYEDTHRQWIARFPEDSIAPTISEDVRDHFSRLAKARRLPLPRYLQVTLEDQLPHRIKLSLEDGSVRWSGDIGLADATSVWGPRARAVQMNIEANPDELQSLGFAIARLGIHADRSTLHLNVSQWQPFLERLSCSSLHAEDLALPPMRPVSDNTSILNATDLTPEVMAAQLNHAMDGWVLGAIDTHLQAYLASGDDPGRVVGFKAADDLRIAMKVVWEEWCQSFAASPRILACFLRLEVCAKDGIDHESEAQALVGPKKLKLLVRATAVALAVATGWQVIAPHGEVPGNLVRASDGMAWTGHACAADLIEGEPIAISAARFMWKTHFVVLPMVNSPIGVSLLAATPLITTQSQVPRLSEVDDGANLFLTVDHAFITAVQVGCKALGELLAAVEDSHFRRLKAAIEEADAVGVSA